MDNKALPFAVWAFPGGCWLLILHALDGFEEGPFRVVTGFQEGGGIKIFVCVGVFSMDLNSDASVLQQSQHSPGS